MKTKFEIPAPILRRAKAMAVKRGIPFRQFVTEAVEEKVRKYSPAEERLWIKLCGKLSHLGKENARINKVIEREFERIEPEDLTAST